MADLEIVNLPIKQVTRIVSKGAYQLVDPNPLFLEKTIIQVDLALVTDTLYIYLPNSSVYKLGSSQEFIFQTIGEAIGEPPYIEIRTYIPPKGEKVALDRINGKVLGSIQDFGKDGNWYTIQLLAPNRWSAELI
jgi:hypothetical protein